MFISYLGGLTLANIESAKKRARQAIVRRDRNQQMKSAIRKLEKKVRQAIAAKDQDGAATMIRQYESAIDKAASKGKYHTKTASRKVSRLTIAMNKAMNS